MESDASLPDVLLGDEAPDGGGDGGGKVGHVAMGSRGILKSV